MRPSPTELEEAYHVIERERFWSKVNLNGPIHPVLGTRCWLWEAAHQQRSEYGVFRLRGTNTPAGKAALTLSGIEVIEGLLICHRCDNPPCVRPEHLFQGTDQDNSDDKVSKGRSCHGESHPKALLTEVEARGIIAAHLDGARGKDIALRYGVSASTVGAILTGKQWRHLTKGVSVSRGKGKGEASHVAKLTEAVVLDIKRRHTAGTLGNLSQLARELGVNRHAIYAILDGRTWTHVKL